MALDLPAFERPAKAISGTTADGKSESDAAEMTNRAERKSWALIKARASRGCVEYAPPCGALRCQRKHEG